MSILRRFRWLVLVLAWILFGASLAGPAVHAPNVVTLFLPTALNAPKNLIPTWCLILQAVLYHELFSCKAFLLGLAFFLASPLLLLGRSINWRPIAVASLVASTGLLLPWILFGMHVGLVLHGKFRISFIDWGFYLLMAAQTLAFVACLPGRKGNPRPDTRRAFQVINSRDDVHTDVTRNHLNVTRVY